MPTPIQTRAARSHEDRWLLSAATHDWEPRYSCSMLCYGVKQSVFCPIVQHSSAETSIGRYVAHRKHRRTLVRSPRRPNLQICQREAKHHPGSVQWNFQYMITTNRYSPRRHKNAPNEILPIQHLRVLVSLGMPVNRRGAINIVCRMPKLPVNTCQRAQRKNRQKHFPNPLRLQLPSQSHILFPDCNHGADRPVQEQAN